MGRLVLIAVVLFVFSACAPYRPACQTKAGKKKLEYYNSIQYKSANKKYTKNKSAKKRVAVF